MTNSIASNQVGSHTSVNMGKVLFVLSGVFLCIVALMIFQDFLASQRRGYAFYFSESLLFKTIWFLFIPILAVLYKKLKNGTIDSFVKKATFIVPSIAVHLFLLPFAAVIFSVLFFEGRYDLYKFFSFTLAHDLYKLIIVYTGFVLGYKYFSIHSQIVGSTENKRLLDTIVVHNGKENVIVKVKDIVQITSATPYIFIHLENKRYLHSETLRSIGEQLDNDIFVRVHRSAVVNITQVSSFKSRLNGDYDLQLANGDLVRLSRTYTADFKSRFNTGQRVEA